MKYYAVVGNTKVTVQDLGRSCPGVCEHCGKLHIRYLATVEQDIADTLIRKGDEIPMEQYAEMSFKVIDGAKNKVINVGCVCVAKYLFDCGVDAGLAQRVAERVNAITYRLQQLAALEVLSEAENLEASVASWNAVLNDRMTYQNFLSTTKAPDDYMSPEYASFYNKVAELRGVFDKAAKKWKAKHKGYRTYFQPIRPVTADSLKAYYDRCARDIQVKLSAFQRAGQYV